MSITKKPKLVDASAPRPALAEKAVEAFISGAPDAAKPSRLMRGKKAQISLTLKPELVDLVDAEAEKMGMSRANWISAAIYRALQREQAGTAI